MKFQLTRKIKGVLKKLLSGDKHVWGWVTLDVSNPIPPKKNLQASA